EAGCAGARVPAGPAKTLYPDGDRGAGGRYADLAGGGGGDSGGVGHTRVGACRGGKAVRLAAQPGAAERAAVAERAAGAPVRGDSVAAEPAGGAARRWVGG